MGSRNIPRGLRRDPVGFHDIPRDPTWGAVGSRGILWGIRAKSPGNPPWGRARDAFGMPWSCSEFLPQDPRLPDLESYISTTTDSFPKNHQQGRLLVRVGVWVRVLENPTGSRGIPGGHPREPVGPRRNTRGHAGTTWVASRGVLQDATLFHGKSRGMPWDTVVGSRGMPRVPARSHENSHGIPRKTHRV